MLLAHLLLCQLPRAEVTALIEAGDRKSIFKVIEMGPRVIPVLTKMEASIHKQIESGKGISVDSVLCALYGLRAKTELEAIINRSPNYIYGDRVHYFGKPLAEEWVSSLSLNSAFGAFLCRQVALAYKHHTLEATETSQALSQSLRSRNVQQVSHHFLGLCGELFGALEPSLNSMWHKADSKLQMELMSIYFLASKPIPSNLWVGMSRHQSADVRAKVYTLARRTKTVLDKEVITRGLGDRRNAVKESARAYRKWLRSVRS
ncbi:MAG: hypothetical protein ABL949_17035 [Fimbriimonadaceae bacterium]